MTTWRRGHSKQRGGRRYQDPKVHVQARRRPKESSADQIAKQRSIEEQLRHQRRKQQAAQPAPSEQKKTKQKEAIGNYRYDSEKGSYFPAESVPKKSSKKRPARRLWDEPTLTSSSLSLTPFTPGSIHHGILMSSVQICGSRGRSQQLRDFWAGRVLSSGMEVVPSAVMASNQAGSVFSLLAPLRRGPMVPGNRPGHPKVPLDFQCKLDLHPANRTMDIHAPSDPNRLPSIATLIEGGSCVRFGRQPKLWSLPPTKYDDSDLVIFECPHSTESAPHVIRFAPERTQDPSHFVVGNLCRTRQADSENLFRLWSGSEGVVDRHETAFRCEMNDFVMQDRKVAFAPSYSRSTTFGALVMDIERMDIGQNTETRRFPPSDALCVEFTDSTANALYGHRNGSLSLVDFRYQSASVVFSGTKKGPGSVTGISLLDNFVLAKHSGSIGVFDIRRMGSGQLWSLTVESGDIQPNKSSCCTGIAVDPTGNYCISPYINARNEAHVGIWSLHTGNFVGSRQLTSESNQRRAQESGLFHCELSGTVTPAWSMGATPGEDTMAKRVPGRFGLWMKEGKGEFPAAQSAGVGSIHQITFPGSIGSLL